MNLSSGMSADKSADALCIIIYNLSLTSRLGKMKPQLLKDTLKLSFIVDAMVTTNPIAKNPEDCSGKRDGTACFTLCWACICGKGICSKGKCVNPGPWGV